MGRGATAAAAMAVVAMAGCGGGRDDEAAVRATAEKYIEALGRGDGAAACRLMSTQGMKDGGYATFRQCARSHSRARYVGRFRVVRVRMEKGGRGALAEVNDADVSDSGDDAIEL